MLKVSLVFRLQLEQLLAFAEKHVGHKPGFDTTRNLIAGFADADPDAVMEQFYQKLRPLEKELKDRDPTVIERFESLPFFGGLGLGDEYAKATKEDQTQLWALLTTLYFLAMQNGDIGNMISGSVQGVMGKLGLGDELRAPGMSQQFQAQVNQMLPRLQEFMPILQGLSADLGDDSDIPPDLLRQFVVPTEAGGGGGDDPRRQRAFICQGEEAGGEEEEAGEEEAEAEDEEGRTGTGKAVGGPASGRQDPFSSLF